MMALMLGLEEGDEKEGFRGKWEDLEVKRRIKGERGRHLAVIWETGNLGCVGMDAIEEEEKERRNDNEDDDDDRVINPSSYWNWKVRFNLYIKYEHKI